MSLRSKVIGILMCVFFLYVIAAWLTLKVVHTPTFDRLESNNAVEQMQRINAFIESERAAVDLLVTDWAVWDDTMEYVLGEYDEYYDENLDWGYIGELGMSFAAIFDSEANMLWGEAYADDNSIVPLESIFPGGINTGHPLLSPKKENGLMSGFINTPHGPAIVSSSAILWNNGDGPVGGHMLVGKLLDEERMAYMSRTMLTKLDLVQGDLPFLLPEFDVAYEQLITGAKRFVVVKQADLVYGLSLMRDITGQPIGMLRVANESRISDLAKQTVLSAITVLMVSALILTLTLWIALRVLFLSPIEHLTKLLSASGNDQHENEDGRNLLSTIKKLSEVRGSLAHRNDEIGSLLHAFDDLSYSINNSTAAIWRVAHLDGLTGLANRRLFVDRLNNALVSLEVGDTISILFIDLDDFKIVNDNRGHEAGDQVLAEVASRLVSIMGNSHEEIDPEDDCLNNLVARIGGDEFVVLLASKPLSLEANIVAERIVLDLAKPINVEGEDCHIGACVGLSVFPDDACDLDEFLANADAAMYEAKRAGKGRWRRFTPGIIQLQEKKRA